MQYEPGQITVKFRLAGSEDVRRISILKTVTLSELKEQLSKILKCSNCEVQFQHEDGRLLSINSDEELKVAITLSLAKIPPILRISVSSVPTPLGTIASPFNTNVNFGLQQANPAEKPIVEEEMAVENPYRVITIVDGPDTAPHSPQVLSQIEDSLNESQMEVASPRNNVNDLAIPSINNNNAIVPQHEAVCHVCDSIIVGVRFKCFECVDYDLCDECEQIPDVHPASHMLLKVKMPEKYGLLPSKKYFKKIGQAPNKKYFQKWEKKVLKHHSKSKKAIEKYFSKITKLGKHLRNSFKYSEPVPKEPVALQIEEISQVPQEHLTASDNQLINEFTVLKESIEYEVLDSSSEQGEESVHLLENESEVEPMPDCTNNNNNRDTAPEQQTEQQNSWQSSLMQHIVNHQNQIEEQRLMSAEDKNQNEPKVLPPIYQEYFPHLCTRLMQSQNVVEVEDHSARQSIVVDVDTDNNSTMVEVHGGCGEMQIQTSVHCEPSAPVIEEHHHHEAPKEEYMVPTDFAYSTQLVDLLDAGFTDVAINVQLLNQHNGSLQAVFEALLNY